MAGRLVTAQNGVGGDMPVTLTYEKTVDAENGNNLVLSIDSNIQPEKVTSISFGGIWGNARIFFCLFFLPS